MPLTVLATTDFYLPGYRGGGTIRSLANLVDRLGQEIQFKIITANRDADAPAPYPDVPVDRWTPCGHAQVRYLATGRRAVVRAIGAAPHDVLYLNSFFSPEFSIGPLLARRLGMIGKAGLLIAPRGELSPAALALKPAKKAAYRRVAQVMSLCRDALWQASSEHEQDDIRRAVGRDARVVVVPDLASPRVAALAPRAPKTKGRLKLAFLGRVSRMKNLDYALRSLIGLRGEVDLDIYGPLHEHDYWDECRRIIDSLPPSVRVRLRGEIAHDEVAGALAAHDVLYLPSLGENFGHAVVEALSAGCPVLISDRTPWRDLQAAGVGWDLSLEQPERFRAALQECLDLDGAALARLSAAAAAFGQRIGADARSVELNRDLFAQARDG